jgi:hypothetical protein
MRLINALFNRPNALRGREKGRRVFVLANGPSANDENLSLLKNEVVIGMNASTMLEGRFGFTSRYYVVSDARFMTSPEKRGWATDKLSEITHRVMRADLRIHDDPALEGRTTYVPALTRDGFSYSLSTGYYYGCTTTMLALQLAWHLGSREVYMLGCDLRYPEERPRFYEEAEPQLEDAFTSVQLENIVRAATVFEKAGGKLVNCSTRSFLRPYLEFGKFSEIFKN